MMLVVVELLLKVGIELTCGLRNRVTCQFAAFSLTLR